MKKSLFFFILLIVCITLFAQTRPTRQTAMGPYLQLNLGLDVGGKMKDNASYDNIYGQIGSGSGNWKTNTGVTPSLEVFWPTPSQFHFGGGVAYQFQRGFNESHSGNAAFNYVPIYAAGKYQFYSASNNKTELLAHLGYNVLLANKDFKGDLKLSGGVCWGIGIAEVFNKKIVAQLMYQQETGKRKYDSAYEHLSEDLTYSHVTASFGYRW